MALSLLVLNVEIPSVPGDELASALRALWSDLVAYMIGFAVIGLFWFGHHRLFSRLVREGRFLKAPRGRPPRVSVRLQPRILRACSAA